MSDKSGLSTVAPDGSEHHVMEPITDQYVAGLRFAADLMHAEARWQTELAMRAPSDRPDVEGTHQYAAGRAVECEKAIRGVIAITEPHNPPGERA